MLDHLFQSVAGRTRWFSPENPTGAIGGGARCAWDASRHPPSKHASRELGTGWKVQPALALDPGETITLLDVPGAGVVQHLWMTFFPKHDRSMILRAYWDGESKPSVEVPLPEFFCQGWGDRQTILAQPIGAYPWGGLNCFLPMPFARGARVEITNRSSTRVESLYYTLQLWEGPVDAPLRFHASFREENPTAPGRDFTVLDDVFGSGRFAGCFMGWQQNSPGWWGEGEIKFYLDGDDTHPSLCGTGTEDYFGGAWNFGGRSYSGPFMGFANVSVDQQHTPNESAGNRHTMYRFHVHDPIVFHTRLRVAMQALGWQSEKRYLQLADHVFAVAYWYQDRPATAASF